ncbi:DUF1652 domain-containing protein [Pseudomonas granadensis]
MRTGVSVHRLRRTLELAFHPLSCDCKLSADDIVTIKLYERYSGRVDLVVTSVRIGNHLSSLALSILIEELRCEIAVCRGSFL